ncbi:MAG: prevent-host-death family protein [Bacteroidetes bacterium QH_8_67_23]|nr:MAG: prevent-host-death family protein [Bacteroidetes bacterium QH_9_67_14]PSQ77825.1 MAG: prevent-host-death family protein [Bacteroidetes bacterium QH_8_67_23]
MNSVSTTDARSRFPDVVDRAAHDKERVILTRRGEAVAAVVSLDDIEALEAVEDRLDLEMAREALEEAEGKEHVRWDDLKRELDLA